MRSKSIELRKAGHTPHIIIPGMVVQSLIILVNSVGVRKESHIQGVEQAGVELLMLILPVTLNRIRENARKKGITGLARLILILVIMNTRKDTNQVAEDHLIKTEVESILDTAGTEEKILQNIRE